MINETKDTKKINSTDSKPNFIFTESEVRDFVRSFIFGYLSGQITIDFPGVGKLIKELKNEGIPYKLNQKDADVLMQGEAKIKTNFSQLISICCGGYQQASSTEIQEAISRLFYMILLFRSMSIINGNFFAYSNLEDRLHKLEEGRILTEELVRKFVDELNLIKNMVDELNKRVDELRFGGR